MALFISIPTSQMIKQAQESGHCPGLQGFMFSKNRTWVYIPSSKPFSAQGIEPLKWLNRVLCSERWTVMFQVSFHFCICHWLLKLLPALPPMVIGVPNITDYVFHGIALRSLTKETGLRLCWREAQWVRNIYFFL